MIILFMAYSADCLQPCSKCNGTRIEIRPEKKVHHVRGLSRCVGGHFISDIHFSLYAVTISCEVHDIKCCSVLNVKHNVVR